MPEYRVQFEVFEGPLDLLLHLVRKQEVDIYKVNLTRIATEFVSYIEQMRQLDVDVAGEFVVMAATLLYIKSRELLPVDKQAIVEDDDAHDDDPRWELIRRLVEYKKFKDAATHLKEREDSMDLVYEHRPARPDIPDQVESPRPIVSVFDLVQAVATLLKRHGERSDIREIQADPHTVSDRIDFLRKLAATKPSFRFGELFEAAQSRAQVVVTFLALLELIRMKVLLAFQAGEFEEILVSAAPPEVDPAQPELAFNAPTAAEPQPNQEPFQPTLPPADIVPPPVAPADREPPSTIPIAEPPGPAQA